MLDQPNLSKAIYHSQDNHWSSSISNNLWINLIEEHIDEHYLLEDSIDLPSNETILKSLELLVVTKTKEKNG